MIYPRLKMKSEVTNSLLDGSQAGKFRLDNEFDKTKIRLENDEQ